MRRSSLGRFRQSPSSLTKMQTESSVPFRTRAHSSPGTNDNVRVSATGWLALNASPDSELIGVDIPMAPAARRMCASCACALSGVVNAAMTRSFVRRTTFPRGFVVNRPTEEKTLPSRLSVTECSYDAFAPRDRSMPTGITRSVTSPQGTFRESRKARVSTICGTDSVANEMRLCASSMSDMCTPCREKMRGFR